MVTAKALRNIIGIIGNFISFGLFLSPVPTFWRIHTKKSVEEFQPYPYIATTMNCMLWVFYGLPVVHPDSILVSTINGVGLVIEAIYLSIFYYYDDTPDRKNRKLVNLWIPVEIVSVILIIFITTMGLHSTFAKTTFVGIICDIFNIAMYASPTLVVGKVIKTRSVEYMPFWLSFIGCINAMIWTAYSLIYKLDLYIFISNGLGTFFGVIQLVVYALYCRESKDGAGGKASEMELAA